MTKKWLAVEAALAKLDVSSTVVVELRVKAAMITIYTCSLVELIDARTLLCYPVHDDLQLGELKLSTFKSARHQ